MLARTLRLPAIAFRSIAIAALIAVPWVTAQEMDVPPGAELYVRHCAACHGRFGEGDGPVAEVMQVNVPNLRTLSDRSGGSFPRYAVMRYIDGRDLPAAHGERLMPVWGDTFAGDGNDGEDGNAIAHERIGAITDFVERLQY